ncbi:SRPBCC family protein [Pendulispora rubella]|uniref:SRPBCC family protein n=1 Tax=Pendulispora rubella TaxID=2741070 RepID=A0ABZ2KU84_9BACT
MTTTTDRIEKKVLLRAPRSRVWNALTTAEEFGTWFEVELTEKGKFVVGARIEGRFSKNEPIAPMMTIERLEPEQLFSYRWVPYSMEATMNYDSESKTLVEFRLEEQEGGVLLTVVESGFDSIPAARRAKAYQMNEGGWTQQMDNIERYVAARTR